MHLNYGGCVIAMTFGTKALKQCFSNFFEPRHTLTVEIFRGTLFLGRKILQIQNTKYKALALVALVEVYQ